MLCFQPKKHKTGRGETSRIHSRTIYLHEHDVHDTENPPSVYGEDTFGDNTAQDDPVLQEDSMEYILGDNGLPIGWLTYKPSFTGTTHEGNVSDLWKAWHEEGVDVITKYGEHSNKWHATWTAAEVNQYNRLHFIIDHILEEVGGNMDLLTATLRQMDGEKGGAKLSTVYTRIKNIIKLESPMKH
jgi:hypothetical protein